MRTRRLLPVAAVVGLAALLLTPVAVDAAPAAPSAPVAPADVDGPRTLIVDDDGMGAIGSCDHRAKAYTRIDDAIRAARPGDTIIVCPGVYPDPVTVDKRVRIVGPNEGVDPRETLAPGAVITGPFVITAPATIDGLIFEGICGPAVTSTVPVDVRNSVFRNNAAGLRMSSTGSRRSNVQKNVFIANNAPCPLQGNGIYADGLLSDVLIEDNQFLGQRGADIRIDPPDDKTADGIVIQNNKADRGFSVGQLVNGVIVYNHLGPQALPAPEARTGALAAMGQQPDAGAAPHHATAGRSARVGVHRALGTWGHPALQAQPVDPATNPPAWGVQIGGGANGMVVADNTIVGAIDGVLVDNEKHPGPNVGVVAERNCIAGNIQTGMNVQPGSHTGVLLAEQNWWGAGDGAGGGTRSGTGDTILDPSNVVDAEPFLLAPPGAACPLRARRLAATSVPPPAPVNAPVNAPTGGVAAGVGGTSGLASARSGWRLAVLLVTVACGLLVVRILREGPRRGTRLG